MGIVEITPEQCSLEPDTATLSSLRNSPFFLLLGMGAELGSQENPLPSTRSICSLPGAQLRVLSLVGKDRISFDGQSARICIELAGRQSSKARITTANKIVSAIGGLFAQVHHTVYHEFEPYQIPKRAIARSEVNLRILEQVEALTSAGPSNSALKRRLGTLIVIPRSALASIFYLLPFVLGSEDLYNACAFFRSCCSDYNLMDGVVSDVLHEPRREPENERERLALENVVLQSFRTVEAIVGEPGKDEKRFHARLEAWGLSHRERVGFPGKRKKRLEDRIRWLQSARDSAAAHGKRRRTTPFTMFEAMEAQHLADAVLHRALWFTAESNGRAGSDAEIGFLLGEMFPFGVANWTRSRKLFAGKSAVDLARSRGGLKKINRYCGRQSLALPAVE
jgi:hypothetical protein